MKETFYERIGEAVCRERLTNGLEVCVVPKPGYAKKYAFFSTRYGGMDTRFCLDGQWLNTPAGIAHYLEHKMFDTREGNALQELAKNGAEPNAFTANAMTAYYFDSTEHFEENLRILLSFVSIPYFTDESVAKEQGIIGQEIRMIEDNPDWQIYTRMLRAMYHRHAARTSIAGTVESIAEITADTLYDCHKAFYTPANMILTVVGDVDPEEISRIGRPYQLVSARNGRHAITYAPDISKTPFNKLLGMGSKEHNTALLEKRLNARTARESKISYWDIWLPYVRACEAT